MKKIGLISDTHSFLDETIFKHFEDMDEIWHIGDIGDWKVYEELAKFKPLKAVWGNIDDHNARSLIPEIMNFEMEGLKVMLLHIGAIPPKYNSTINKLLKTHEPNLFLCGHSHILRVIKDKQRPNLVYINPGAAGHHGFHHMRTIMRMNLDAGKISHLEVVELGPR
jgi:uncharacterized protein